MNNNNRSENDRNERGSQEAGRQGRESQGADYNENEGGSGMGATYSGSQGLEADDMRNREMDQSEDSEEYLSGSGSESQYEGFEEDSELEASGNDDWSSEEDDLESGNRMNTDNSDRSNQRYENPDNRDL